MNPSPNFDPFSEDSIDRVHTVESLPHSVAFENVMYTKRLRRTAKHTMNNPISLSPTLMNGKFPDALQPLFTSSTYAISDLVVAQIETIEGTPVSFEVAFKANDLCHSIRVDGGFCIYKTENYNNDSLTYTFDPSIIVGLLASFVYARQFKDSNPMSPIDLVENQLNVPRDAQTAFVEQLIITLGHYDGASTISTDAIFDTPNGALIASFTEGEKPHMSNFRNRIELTRLTLDDMSGGITMHQNEVNVKSKSGVLENQFAERFTSDIPELIDPSRDFEEWAKICDEFLSAIEADLARYAYLDE